MHGLSHCYRRHGRYRTTAVYIVIGMIVIFVLLRLNSFLLRSRSRIQLCCIVFTYFVHAALFSCCLNLPTFREPTCRADDGLTEQRHWQGTILMAPDVCRSSTFRTEQLLRQLHRESVEGQPSCGGKVHCRTCTKLYSKIMLG